mgnify:FL=1|jgi:hypothetical protein
MKNLIIRWLGLDKLKAEVSKLEDDTFKVVEELVRSEVDNVKYDIQSDVKYELEDDFLSKDDATSQFEEVLADYELDDLTTKVHQLDDRLTELVAGYKLEVQLVKEEF